MRPNPLVAGIIPLGLFSLTLTVAVFAFTRSADAKDIANAAQRTADLNELRIEHIKDNIARIETHMGRLVSRFEKIDSKFDSVQKQLQAILMHLPSRTDP
jgi:signal transduction histidine kinase